MKNETTANNETKTFTFTATWPKRARQGRPSFKKGVIVSSNEIWAEAYLRSRPEFKDVEFITVAPLETYAVIAIG